VSQLALGSVMVGVAGCTIWVFAAIAMAPLDHAQGILHEGQHGG
jgi:hypothetical protein